MTSTDHRHERKFHPALGLRILNRIFDPLLRLWIREERFRQRLVELMRIGPGQRVLDVGCGTGTLLLQIKRQEPAAEVVGLDPDLSILDIARKKAAAAGVPISFEVGFGDRLPHPDGSFDHVVSSLAFHHLTRQEKREALSEAFRILRPGGGLHIADFGQPRGLAGALVLPVAALGQRAGDNLAGHIPVFIAQVGFVEVDESARIGTGFGPVSLYQARRPSTPPASEATRG
jgi:SAM-dependent methyltransferase